VNKLLTTVAVAASFIAAANAETFQVPLDVSEGRLNIRSGPGVRFALIGAIPAGTKINWPGRATCVPRQDGIRGADWCRVNVVNGGLAPTGGPFTSFGWVSRAALMPIAEQAPVRPSGDSDMMLSTVAPSALELNCGAPRVALGDDPRDNNPVVKVEIRYVADEHQWRVFHHLRDGLVVSRSEQYAIRDSSDARTIQWQGSLNRAPHLYMIGEIRHDENGVVYMEWLYDHKNNKTLVMQASALCASPLPQPTPAQPTHPTPSQPLGSESIVKELLEKL
jgi:hypothetical protein